MVVCEPVFIESLHVVAVQLIQILFRIWKVLGS
jgi:hypothetical protein